MVGRVVLVLFSVSLLLALYFFFRSVNERVLTLQAQRKQAQNEADVKTITAPEGHQVYIRELNDLATWRPAHLDPRLYANGKPTQPIEIELQSWRNYQELRSKPGIVKGYEPELLPAQTSIDLLPELGRLDRCLVRGQTDSGKTTILQWIVHQRSANTQIVVIDPHSEPGMWPGCQIIGAGSNHNEVEQFFDMCIARMEKRYQEIAEGKVRQLEHGQLIVMVDEWMTIAGQCKRAPDAMVRLLTEGRKASFSIIIGSHSDQVRSLGLDGKGDIREGFVFIRLNVVSGLHSATIDYGDGEIPAILPGPYNGNGLKAEAIDMIVKPTEQDMKILELSNRGLSLRQISYEVWGDHGGPRNRQIEKALKKFERI